MTTTPAAARESALRRWAPRLLAVALGLLLFVLALELLKRGAGGVDPLLRGLGVSGMAGGIAVGWLASCLLLSGSPVAAMALTLLASGTLDTAETFGMISGSRLGASFVVLVIGALQDLREGRREARSAYVGVTALVATAVVYLPAMALAWLGLERGALAGLRLSGRDLDSLVQRLYGPVLSLATPLPRLLVFALGIAALLAAFKALDRALPDLERGSGPLLPADHVVYRPWFMFGVGLATTALTLSVSVSIALLVPLAARGYVRRENAWPYILGANVTTLVDTLFAGALVGHPDGARMVALLMGAVTLVSLPVVFVFPYVFGRGLDRVARRATATRGAVVAFVALLFGIPLALLLIF
jgi:Na+/phosphate symporter